MVIKDLMRHKSYRMTLRYAHLHPDHLRGATEILASRGPRLTHAGKEGFLPGPRLVHETQKSTLSLVSSKSATN